MDNPIIVIIGLGYIGLPTALALAEAGQNVLGVDCDRQRVATLNAGHAPYAEPGVQQALVRALETGRFRASDQPVVAAVYVIAVPTPLGPENQPDLRAVIASVEAIAPHLTRGAVLILESTCPVGTTEMIRDKIGQLRPDLRLPYAEGEIADLALAYCPERILPGHAMIELAGNPRCIGGITPACAEAAAQVYRKFVEGPCTLTNARTAEFVKLAENSFRDVNIAFANELSMAADQLGVDIWEARALANQHPRVDMLRPGPGVGGHCVAVDPWFLIQAGVGEMPLLRAARFANQTKTDYVASHLAAQLASDPALRVALLGLTFKADCEDLRQSPALDIACRLAHLFGERVLVVDPYLAKLPPGLTASGAILTSLEAALAEAGLVALLVDHAPFRSMSAHDLEGKLCFDTRGAWCAGRV